MGRKIKQSWSWGKKKKEQELGKKIGKIYNVKFSTPLFQEAEKLWEVEIGKTGYDECTWASSSTTKSYALTTQPMFLICKLKVIMSILSTSDFSRLNIMK